MATGPTGFISPNGGLTGIYGGARWANEWATYYNFPTFSGPRGPTGPTIGVAGGYGSFSQQDLNRVFNIVYNNTGSTGIVPGGITPPQVVGIRVGTWGGGYTGPTGPAAYDPNLLPGGTRGEQNLDTQIVALSCPYSNIYFFQTGIDGGIGDYYYSIKEAKDLGCCAFTSSSTGFETEIIGGQRKFFSTQFYDEHEILFQECINAGMTVCFCTGDFGCFSPLYNRDTGIETYSDFQVAWPACSQYVTAVGGSNPRTSPESAWEGSGGGQAYFTLRPSYQTNITFNTDGNNPVVPSTNPVYPTIGSNPPYLTNITRYIPDVAFSSEDYRFVDTSFFPGFLIGGGTSASTPLLAGLIGNIYGVSQPGSIAKNGYAPYGFNHYLYNAPSNCFFDFTTGGNNTLGNPGATGTTTSTVTRALQGYDLSTGLGAINGKQFQTFVDTLTCVPGSTKILLPDLTYKEIKYLKKGDYVVSSIEEKLIYKVSRVIKQLISPQTILNVVIFPKDYFEKNIPRDRLIITNIHVIKYKDKEEECQYFKNYEKIIAKDILDDEEGFYYLYDIQFEYESCYIAEGLILKSRSPKCPLVRNSRFT